MNIFVDTNVLVAAADGNHQHYSRASRIVDGLKSHELFCAAHSIAEFYATTTRMPREPRLTPSDCLVVLEDLIARVSPVTLTAAEYLSTVRHIAEAGLAGAIVYDALLLACARKCKAVRIYTFNERHFTRIAPELAAKIRTP